jgi:DNA polymerase-3 subunit gamma/tau
MFASTHPQGFPPAILSRLQRFDVRRLTVPEITGKLQRILAADGREADPEAVAVVARLAAGGMRDAESILDQLLSSTAGRIEADAVRDLLGLADADLVDGFTDALAAGDAATGVGLLDRLEERGRDLRVFLDQVVDSLRERLVADLANRGAADPGIAAAARRLAGIDPTRLGPGGLRLQLELALLEPSLAYATAEAAGGGRARPAPVPVAPEPPREPSREPLRDQARPVSPYEFGRTAPSDEGDRAPARERVRADATPEIAARTPGPAPEAEPASPIAPPLGTVPPLDPAPSRGVVPASPGRDTAPAADPAPAAGPAPVAPLGPVGAADVASGDDLERLLKAWTALVADLARRPALKQLIEASRPVGIEGNVVSLGFPEEKAFLRDHAEKRKAAFEEAIGERLGHAVNVRCVISNLDALPPLPDDQEAGRILAEANRIFADDRLDVPEVT